MDTSFPSCNLLLLWLLLLAIMLQTGMCGLRVHCNEKDYDILQNFKTIVVDPSAILSTWSDDRDCCEWKGVQCDNTTGRVIELNLPCPLKSHAHDCGEKKSQCLTGELHLSLLQIEFLNYLNLSNNDFQAVINLPHSCENSSNLHYLDLSYNEDLHIDNLHWLSRVSSLKYLNFGGINLQGKVDWLQLATLLPSLAELHLDSCQLRNNNPSFHFVNFTSLEVVSLSDNSLLYEYFPNWLFNLSDVTIVDLSYNQFQSQLPESLLKLQKLKVLHLQNNKLNGPIPDWLGQLEHLQVLDVGNNLFSGPIPSTLGNLSSLIILNIRSNNLNDSLPKSLGQLLNLEELYFYDNPLMGAVSERNFIKLSNLKHLYFGSPDLVFDFNSLWVPPFQLESILLNYVAGPKLPSWLYTQQSLWGLAISNSTLSFESRDKFWYFAAHLRFLVLDYNNIDGDISHVILNTTIVYLRSNKMEGTVPRLSSNVVVFNAENNSLQGPISPLFCQKKSGRNQLKYLDMSNNLLSGGLTNCWKYWKSLVYVKLRGNNLTGKIPSSIGFLSNLMILYLDKNNLFGEIPWSLKNCHNLQILDVGENKFSGSIPSWIGHNVKVLRLRSNELSGIIPPKICQLASLVDLDFAENKISGSIPACLNNLTTMAFPHSSYSWIPILCFRFPEGTIGFQDNVMLQIKGQRLIYEENLKLMRAIDLSSNNISGTIPPEIFSLTYLNSLNLSHNQFEGTIPKVIGNLKQLESLDLANNRLSGEIPQSMAELSFLGFLNLSFNNLSGKIPLGTQLQGFDVLTYIGNPELCGSPLPKNCLANEDDKGIEEKESQEYEFLSSFYIGWTVGFAIAFWAVCGAIFFNRNFRHSYFRFLHYMKDKLHVMVVLKMNRFH